MPPSFLHNNGSNRLLVTRGKWPPNLGPVYCRLLERPVLAGTRGGSVETTPGVDIVLCSTRQQKQYTERVLDACGIRDYTVLGRHLAEWKNILKIKLVLDHIESHPEPELLMHLDATDVLMVGPLQAAVDAFLQTTNCDLLFGAEKGSAPGSNTARGITGVERRLLETIEDFERRTYAAPFQHLNAGCFIGRKPAIRELFSRALELQKSLPVTTVLPTGNHLAEDDQLILRELHRLHHPRIQIDDTCEVFQNLFAIERSELAVEQAVPRGAEFIAACLRHVGALGWARARRVMRWSS